MQGWVILTAGVNADMSRSENKHVTSVITLQATETRSVFISWATWYSVLVSAEIPLLIYSFYFLDYICNLLSRKCDFGCLISTANIVKGNTKAAENTWLPCLKLYQCCADLIRDASAMNTWSEFLTFPIVHLHLFPLLCLTATLSFISD